MNRLWYDCFVDDRYTLRLVNVRALDAKPESLKDFAVLDEPDKYDPANNTVVVVLRDQGKAVALTFERVWKAA